MDSDDIMYDDFEDVDNEVYYTTLNEAFDSCIRRPEHLSWKMVYSGFHALDTVKKGWHPNELSIVGGQPGIGKSAFIYSVMGNMAKEGQETILFSTPDISNPHNLTRMFSCTTKRELDFRFGDDVRKLLDVKWNDTPIFLVLRQRMTLSCIRANALAICRQHNIKCIFIDNLQTLFNSETSIMGKNRKEIILFELKILASELNIPIIATSEVSSSANQRGAYGKAPVISDMHSSDAINYIADSILLLYRPVYHHLKRDEKGTILDNVFMVNVVKNKYGACGDARLYYNTKHHTVEGLIDKELQIEKFQEKLKSNEPFQKLNDIFDLEQEVF